MDILVVGATRGTGRALTDTLVADGHTVTAFGRTATATFATTPPGPGTLRAVDGDVLDADAVAKAVAGQDAVVVTLGISDNPVTVRLLRRASTALDVRSRGTAVVLGAMRDQGVRRVVVQTTYGLGDTWQRLDLRWKATFRLLLWPQLKDSAKQEDVVRASGLDWTLVRPVALSDAPTTTPARVSDDGSAAGFTVSRHDLARALADVATDRDRIGRTLAVSAPA
ncbi:NAD-dependent epimerase/dehydratase [Xylanimonas cellulosilytica DSM 15894]|uniref:NAD-dependent epimerase/dehydratase n=1 Tax=Xylanimonas cellulosilytica (strain DSM 15894 / JCM 12276 / CECT 5975 / KCTC 9989 / LMG 20990 / NBRC 107835 / XIL07) TaxID=446471 RepID=D1BRX3_XYLCX|nr:NAD(P)-binding oxidoreductase [Xylanimonas cellulosilytica]ACZ30465.1 NAD-dependent epimerase/dehydratase [Xylanimonas cellulosilytica DSM 15894]